MHFSVCSYSEAQFRATSINLAVFARSRSALVNTATYRARAALQLWALVSVYLNTSKHNKCQLSVTSVIERGDLWGVPGVGIP